MAIGIDTVAKRIGQSRTKNRERALDRDAGGIESDIEEVLERVAANTELQSKLDAAIDELRTGSKQFADWLPGLSGRLLGPS